MASLLLLSLAVRTPQVGGKVNAVRGSTGGGRRGRTTMHEGMGKGSVFFCCGGDSVKGWELLFKF